VPIILISAGGMATAHPKFPNHTYRHDQPPPTHPILSDYDYRPTLALGLYTFCRLPRPAPFRPSTFTPKHPIPSRKDHPSIHRSTASQSALGADTGGADDGQRALPGVWWRTTDFMPNMMEAMI
jgi:hypothetical protein